MTDITCEKYDLSQLYLQLVEISNNIEMRSISYSSHMVACAVDSFTAEESATYISNIQDSSVTIRYYTEREIIRTSLKFVQKIHEIYNHIYKMLYIIFNGETNNGSNYPILADGEIIKRLNFKPNNSEIYMEKTSDFLDEIVYNHVIKQISSWKNIYVPLAGSSDKLDFTLKKDIINKSFMPSFKFSIEDENNHSVLVLDMVSKVSNMQDFKYLTQFTNQILNKFFHLISTFYVNPFMHQIKLPSDVTLIDYNLVNKSIIIKGKAEVTYKSTTVNGFKRYTLHCAENHVLCFYGLSNELIYNVYDSTTGLVLYDEANETNIYQFLEGYACFPLATQSATGHNHCLKKIFAMELFL